MARVPSPVGNCMQEDSTIVMLRAIILIFCEADFVEESHPAIKTSKHLARSTRGASDRKFDPTVVAHSHVPSNASIIAG